ncbi:uncharacterized protein LOC126554640, partial [Aphis gossypii]|uniref:uncharacterized protein LOC126554640 n=1 Tax=Aphis gossypii TaxID=80765 RepID=UPI002158A1BC
VFKQIGVDLITLPEVNNLRYVVVAICYFRKWCEARALVDKTAVSVAKFLYDDIICRHGCPEIQISDQGREFVNKLSDELFRLTGTQQRVTSPYHSQANGLVERLNRTLKTSLLKVQQNDVLKWPDILQGIMFAYRTTVHCSTKYSPFFMLYQREPVIPVDVDVNNNSNSEFLKEEDIDYDLDEVTFSKTVQAMLDLRGFYMESNNL